MGVKKKSIGISASMEGAKSLYLAPKVDIRREIHHRFTIISKKPSIAQPILIKEGAPYIMKAIMIMNRL